MNYENVKTHIVNWLLEYQTKSRTEGFIIGISGGVDSAVTSTLCALTGKKLLAVNMPIKQTKAEHSRSLEHIQWLKSNFKNVESEEIDLTNVLTAYENALPKSTQDFLAMANTRSRIRMTTLYAMASHYKLLVAGTGNKVEDFGIGFFTKFGDGGVDISPIADLYKTQVYSLAQHLNIVDSILNCKPTDGLFDDGRTDEDQIGATYEELEWAMEYVAKNSSAQFTERQTEVMKIYKSRNAANQHKMKLPPVCLIPEALKEKN